jgi:hypothetical protein
VLPQSPSHRRRRTAVLAVLATAVAGAGIAVLTQPTALAAASGPIAGHGGTCVDVAGGSAADGATVQLHRCTGTAAQTWTVGNPDDSVRALGRCLHVAAGATTDGARVQLHACDGTAAQKWTADQGRLRNAGSGKCLDATDRSSADGTPLQIWECATTANQQFALPIGGATPVAAAPSAAAPPAAGNPDLGPNVFVFDPSTPQATIQNRLDTIFAQQERAQFGSGRYAVLFKPGSYTVDANVGYYTHIAGLGLSPDDVTVNGAVHVEADWFQGNATHNFWRAAENLSVNPTGGTDRWAVSQASSYRRMHVRGDLQLDDSGWSSGGFMADTRVDGEVRSGSQQQWLSRNTDWSGWTGSNWNMVFVGALNPPAGAFPNPPYTRISRTPVVREKPFLYVDRAGGYNVFVPALRTKTRGTTWRDQTPRGTSLPISQFHVVKAGATAASINAALAQGKHLLVTPGVYRLADTIRITRPDTVVLGLGLATLLPENGVTALSVADVDGVKVAGLLIDAGQVNSRLLMEVGPAGSSADHSANPTSLHDVYVRVGGAAVGRATESLRINSDDVIGDHLWLWRGDHGDGIGWNLNTAARGLVVNGDDVTMYGLFVEHYQKYQTTWNGNRGRTYFYQNEMPYDPPNQAAWMNGSTRGYAAYKVADSVTSHEAWGLGSYCFFNVDRSVVADRAFEVPARAGVRFRNMVTVSLGGNGTISRVINDTGGPSDSATNVANVVRHP